MIFTTECPSCVTEFPIDSGKVPEDGVYARCSECEAVFLVENPEPEATYAVPAFDPAPAADDSSDAETSSWDAPPQADVDAPAALVDPPAPPADPPAIDPLLEEQPAAADHTRADAAPKPRPAFGKRDPNERAARLARVLVSDMIAYHPDRHRRSLAAGTLPQDFEEEIEKSWQEYIDQVGKELAESTDFFRDALNQVLARGQEVF